MNRDHNIQKLSHRLSARLSALKSSLNLRGIPNWVRTVNMTSSNHTQSAALNELHSNLNEPLSNSNWVRSVNTKSSLKPHSHSNLLLSDDCEYGGKTPTELDSLTAPTWVAVWTRNGCKRICVQSTRPHLLKHLSLKNQICPLVSSRVVIEIEQQRTPFHKKTSINTVKVSFRSTENKLI